MLTEILCLAGGLAVGLVVAYFIVARWRTRVAVLERERDLELKANAEKLEAGQRYVAELKEQHQAQLLKVEEQYKASLADMRRQHEQQMQLSLLLL
jgi:hypothetical protein